MIIKRPSIFIYTHEADPAVLKEVCAGIEEEGVFYDTTEMPDECMEKLAYKAARDSMLGSGVGIFGTAVCLKMRGLEKGRNIERLSYAKPRPVPAISVQTVRGRSRNCRLRRNTGYEYLYQKRGSGLPLP